MMDRDDIMDGVKKSFTGEHIIETLTIEVDDVVTLLGTVWWFEISRIVGS